MLDISLIILAAGSSTRFELPSSKLFLRLGNLPLWLYTAKRISSFYAFKKVVIACCDLEYMKKFDEHYSFVRGGENRAKSLLNALNIIKSKYVLVSDAARPLISKDLLFKLIDNAKNADCVTPVLKVNDSAIYDNSLINRDKLKLIFTPQLSNTALLKKALLKDTSFAEDSFALASVGGKVWYVNSEYEARKITFKDDLKNLALPPIEQEFFTGSGFDVHEFGQDRPLILGGIKIHPHKGLKAHSDGDVLIHALIDALLGAAALGDIGELYPDNKKEYKDIDSSLLLKDAYKRVQKYGFTLVNADITILMQDIKLSKYKNKIALNLAKILGNKNINIKASTTEKLGFIGRNEGVCALASVSLKYFDWMKI